MQRALRILYPARCLMCDTRTQTDFALCGACWADTPFVTGLACDHCGLPLPGEDAGPVLCDDCLVVARPWGHGRAALAYAGLGRKIVLALKHGDRTDLARPAAAWLAGAAAPLLQPETVIVPVPLHWTRLLRRRYNQSALLANAMGRETGHAVIPDLLVRRVRTATLGGKSRDQRFRELEQAIVARHAERLAGRPVLLVDDVMTSGATLAAATEALHAAGAARVDVAILARAAKDA
jgi:ComF family protein